MWNEHLNEVVNELVTTLQEMTPNKRARVLTKLVDKLNHNIRDPDARSIIAPIHHWMLPDGYIQRHEYVPPPPPAEQRVDATAEEQRVAHLVTRITDAPPIITAPNPTAPRRLQQTARTHSRITRNNIPGSTPPIVNIEKRRHIATTPTPSAPEPIGPRRSTRNVPQTSPRTTKNV